MTARLLMLAALACAGCLDPTVEVCGDGRICPPGTICDDVRGRCVTDEQADACDGLDDGDRCTAPGISSGFCTGGSCAASVCGDRFVDQLEECDRDNLAGESCDSLGFYDGGTLACSSACRYDTTGCAGFCGDGVVNGDELCDGAELGGASCESLGFYQGGDLACSVLCTFDASNCEGRCGDGVAAGPESCDGADLRGADCTDFGYYEPAGLSCTDACVTDTSACSLYCGDGVENGSELCDTTPPADMSCLDLGFDSGLLGCSQVCSFELASCELLGWQPEDSGYGGILFAVHGFAPDQIFAGGELGRIIEWDGDRWSEFATLTQPSGIVRGLWGSSRDDMYAAVDSAPDVLYHYDGSSWETVDTGAAGEWRVVWGSGPNDLFIGGRAGAAARWDGSSWTHYNFGSSEVTAIHGTGPTDVWLGDSGGVLRRWDGSSWTQKENLLSSVRDLWTTPDGDLLVLQSNGYLLRRTNGTLFEVARFGANVWAFSGRSASDMAVVGSDVLSHFDGRTGLPYERSRSASLRDVWMADDGSAMAVGELGITLHYGGRGWTAETQPNAAIAEITGIWGTGPNRLWAVGNGLLLERTVDGWTAGALSSGELNDVWGTAEDDIFVSGLGTMYHFDGDQWSEKSVSGSFEGIWGSGPDDVFAVGSGGSVVHYNGVGWSSMTTPGNHWLRDVWGTGPDNVYAVGLGVILRYDGTDWLVDHSFSPGHLTTIWGRGPGDIYTAGLGGMILHYDGTDWTELPQQTTDTFNDIAGGPGGSILLSGQLGSLWQLDGGQLIPTRAGDGLSVGGIWATDRVTYIGATGTGVLRLLDSNCAASEGSCDDQWDADCDGLIDCADDDCTVACTGLCSGAATIACGDSVNGSTNGAPDEIVNYGCLANAETGAERAYSFTAAASGTVNVVVSPTGQANLDIIALDAGSAGACDPLNQCFLANVGGGSDVGIGFSVVAGRTYYLVVDGPAGGEGNFSLSLTCP